MLALTGKPIKTYYWARRKVVQKRAALAGQLGRNLASYCGEGQGRHSRQDSSVAGVKGRAESSAPGQRLKTPAAGPGNSGILGRSERYYRPGSGSHRYIPVNPLLVSLQQQTSRGLRPARRLVVANGLSPARYACLKRLLRPMVPFRVLGIRALPAIRSQVLQG